MEFEVFGTVMERRGNRGHTAADQDVYRCSGEEDWIAVSVHTDDQRAALADLLGGKDVDIEQWLADQDVEVAAESLAEAGIPAAVVISPSLVTENPQLVHRGFFERLEHPRTGEALYPCPPFTCLDGTQRWLRRTPPTLGQHNEEVLTELCGLTTADLARLAADGVIGTRPKGA
jgi:crotonobetainyl-CoA:carnitine CoA-transferase CaiB-like acyl-CoA transferase